MWGSTVLSKKKLNSTLLSNLHVGSKAFANGQKGGGAWKNVWGQLDSVVEEKIEFDTVVEFARGLHSVCEWTGKKKGWFLLIVPTITVKRDLLRHPTLALTHPECRSFS